MKNNELLKNIFVTYNHTPTIQKAYVYALKHYSNYFSMDLHEFLRKEEYEENKGIKWKHKKIKKQTIRIQTILSEQL